MADQDELIGPQLPEMAEDEDSESDDDAPIADELLAKIKTLQQNLDENPFLYDSHIELISSLRQTGDSDAARKARQSMHQLFPLTEDLWLQWLRDELMLSELEPAVRDTQQLFEKAVDDYLAPGVWLLYGQFAVDHMTQFELHFGLESGLDFPRSIFERAVKSCGLHVTKGSLVWDAYREFEQAVLSSLEQQQSSTEDVSEINQTIRQQYSKVDHLFRRQLALPLVGMEATLLEYEDFSAAREARGGLPGCEGALDGRPKEVNEAAVPGYALALRRLKEIVPFEDRVSAAKESSLEVFREYISLERKGKNVERIVCLFQRAVSQHPLEVGMWMEYTKYMDVNWKVRDAVVGSHLQSVRNCPWSVDLWQSYFRALQRLKCDHDEIIGVFEQSLSNNFTHSGDYLRVWLSYLVYRRSWVGPGHWEAHRRSREEGMTDETSSVQDLKALISRAADYQKKNFGDHADPNGLITRFHAQVEGRYLGNIEVARELWEGLIYWHSNEAEYWLQYSQLEWHHGNKDKCRSVLRRGLTSVQDYPELVFEQYLLFERTEGTLETTIAAEDRVRERRGAIERAERKFEQQELDREARRELEGSRQRSGEGRERGEGEERKSGGGRDKKGGDQKRRKRQHEETPQGNAGNQHVVTESSQSAPRPKKAKLNNRKSEDQPTGDSRDVPTPDLSLPVDTASALDTTTVFLSNLPIATKSSELLSLLSDCGDIEDIRVVKSRKELAKKPFSYAYVQFQSKEAVAKAILKDRTVFFGRQMLVSPFNEKKKNKEPSDVQRFPNSRDKNTVFVSNLPFSMPEEDIRELFTKFGEIRQVRLPIKRQRRGIAYIEFEEEASADTAVKELDQSDVSGRLITVAISDPPKKDRSDPAAMETETAPKSLTRGEGKTRPSMPPPRMIPQALINSRRQKLQISSPYALKRDVADEMSRQATAQPNDSSNTSSGSGERSSKAAGKKMSNADFRKLMGV